jgi:hypothetical protein
MLYSHDLNVNGCPITNLKRVRFDDNDIFCIIHVVIYFFFGRFASLLFRLPNVVIIVDCVVECVSSYLLTNYCRCLPPFTNTDCDFLEFS